MLTYEYIGTFQYARCDERETGGAAVISWLALADATPAAFATWDAGLGGVSDGVEHVG